MKFDLQSIFAIVEASTPEDRWNLLQSWLAKNPEWKDKVDRWLTLPPDTAVIRLQADLAERLKVPVAVFSAMLTTEMRLKAKAAIETLQVCYRERANHNQSEQQRDKEIKNARTKRTVKIGPARSNPKRTHTDRD